MPGPRQTDPSLHEALESALELCRRALADYRGGLIDEPELRRLLFRTGLVQWPDEAWLLDLRAGVWWRYDGVGLGDGGEPVTQAVAGLREVVVELTTGHRGDESR